MKNAPYSFNRLISLEARALQFVRSDVSSEFLNICLPRVPEPPRLFSIYKTTSQGHSEGWPDQV